MDISLRPRSNTDLSLFTDAKSTFTDAKSTITGISNISKKPDKNDQMSQVVNEMKVLIGNVYQFYRAQEDVFELLHHKNPFLNVFLDMIIPVKQSGIGTGNESIYEEEDNFERQNSQPTTSFGLKSEQAKFLRLMQENKFYKVYEKMTSAWFNLRQGGGGERMLIDTQVKKFVKNNLHSKYFLLALTMAANLRGDIQAKERCRLICLACLPLMFEHEEMRAKVEKSISEMPDLGQLVRHDNRDFFRLIKAMIKEEETYNCQNHFEQYFSLSGFVRTLLNEVIKLQTQNEKHFIASSYLIIRLLDTVTYFLSQRGGTGFSLRRAPTKSGGMLEKSAFLFDYLVDYKSFEFLSKLYKISQKLIEYDHDMVIMNMWYKLVENHRANYEIVAKFLIHNLSSIAVKLQRQVLKNLADGTLKVTNGAARFLQNKSQTDPDYQNTDFSMFEISILGNQTSGHTSLLTKSPSIIAGIPLSQPQIEFEKHKRYTLNIINYLRARLQRADVRNSMQVSSDGPSWTRKILEMVPLSNMSIQCKYVLEKVKLKKIVQTMQREVNQSISLIGKVDHQNLLFNFKRIIADRYAKVTASNHQSQLGDILIAYLESALLFIANDTDRQLQQVQITKEQELILVTIIILLIAFHIQKTVDQEKSSQTKGSLQIFKEKIRGKINSSLLKTLGNNLNGIMSYFNFDIMPKIQREGNTGLSLSASYQEVLNKLSSTSALAEFILQFVQVTTSLPEHFDVFTNCYFQVAQNLVCTDGTFRLLVAEIYHQIQRNLQFQYEQSLKSTQNTDFSSKIPRQNIIEQISCTKKMRSTLLAILQTAYANISDLASKSLVTSAGMCAVNKSLSWQTILKNQQDSPRGLASKIDIQQSLKKHQINLIKLFRQHVSILMDYVLFCFEVDHNKSQLKSSQNQSNNTPNTSQNRRIGQSQEQAPPLSSDMISPASKSIVFASNILFWIGIICLQAPNHLLGSNKDQSSNQLLLQLQQIQYVGILAIRRTLEETNFLKILIAYQKISDHFYSYDLLMKNEKTSFLSLVFDSIRNPLCARDALKLLSLSIRVQDSRLLVGQNQKNLDANSDLQKILNESNKNFGEYNSLAKVELIRLLYLVPYCMQQFLMPAGLGSSDDQIFRNKRSIIQLLKKSLPSLGIDKKRVILEGLETIQIVTANSELLQMDQQSESQNKSDNSQELIKQYQDLVRGAVELMQQQGFKSSLVDCLQTFQILYLDYENRLKIYKKQQSLIKQTSSRVTSGQSLPDQPIKQHILKLTIQQIKDVLDLSEERLSKATDLINQEKNCYSIYTDIGIEVLGEEVAKYQDEFRSLYFGMKNLISQEIDAIGKDVSAAQFFDQEAGSYIQNSVSANQNYGLQGYQKGQYSGQRDAQQLLQTPNEKSLITASPAGNETQYFKSQSGIGQRQEAIQKKQTQRISQNSQILQQAAERRMVNPVLNQGGIQGQPYSKNIQESSYNYSKTQENWRGQSSEGVETKQYTNSPKTQNHRAHTNSQRSKSRTRYENEKSCDSQSPDETLQDNLPIAIKGVAPLTSGILRAQTIQIKATFEESGTLRAQTAHGKQTFAEMTLQQQQIQQSYRDDEIEDNLMTFQSKKPESVKTNKQGFSITNTERRQAYNPPEEVFDSTVIRKYNMQTINPIDNQSSQSSHKPNRMISSQIANKIMAIVPNVVAERSNQIWSDVASQKSMSLMTESMNSQTKQEKSFKKTNNEYRKYDKNEPNFNFTDDY